QGDVRRERYLVAQAVRHVGQVAQGGRVMAFEDVGVEVLPLAATDRGEEVVEVVAAPRAATVLDLGKRLRFATALGVELAARDRAGLEVQGVADALALVLLARQPADLEDQQRLAVVEDGDLRAGGLALVLEADPAAQAERAPGQGRAGDGPAG